MGACSSVQNDVSGDGGVGARQGGAGHGHGGSTGRDATTRAGSLNNGARRTARTGSGVLGGLDNYQDGEMKLDDGSGRSQGSLPAAVPGWDAALPPMTEAALQRMRNSFWDTRVEGRREVWSGLRLALEAADDATRLLVLEGIGCSSFRCDSKDCMYVWDMRGFKYELPFYLVYQPRMMTSEQAAAATAAVTSQIISTSNGSATNGEGSAGTRTGTGTGTEMAAGTGTGKNREKSKEPLVKFKIRCSNGRDMNVEAPLKATSVRDVKKIVQKQYSVAPARQRVVYRGRSCVDWVSLADLHLEPLTVVQVFFIPDDVPLPPAAASAT